MNSVFLLGIGVFVGMVGVVSNPSSYFAAGALMVVAGLGCGMLALLGDPFLALVLFIIYLGGMLVVFVYSVAMSSDLYPEAWGGPTVSLYVLGYVVLVVICCVCGGFYLYSGGSYKSVVGMGFDSGFGGICLLYSAGGYSLSIVGASLLLTLLVVLELVRGICFGALKDAGNNDCYGGCSQKCQ